MRVKPVPHYVATKTDKRPMSCGWLPGSHLFPGTPLLLLNAGVFHIVAMACLQHPARKAV